MVSRNSKEEAVGTRADDRVSRRQSWFPVNAPARDFMGWHLSYDPAAEKDMMATINAAIKMKKFGKGVELR